jgi:hypothetical protein
MGARDRRGLVAGLIVLFGCALCGCAQNAASPAGEPRAATAAADARPAPVPETGPAKEAIVAIYAACGLRLVGNEGDAHFTLDLRGTSVHRDADANLPAYIVDDLLVRPHLGRAEMGVLAQGKTGLDLLRVHEAWESASIAREIHAKVEPRESPLVLHGPAAREGLLWWFPLPDGIVGDGPPVHRYAVYATVVLADRVVGLSAVAERGLEPVDVMARLSAWMDTLTPSETIVSVAATQAQIRSEAAPKCPIAGGATVGVDRRLRFDDVPPDAWRPLARTAEQAGGVERQIVDGRVRYRNHICRFALTYPDSSWALFSAQDFSPTGCLLNLVTPEVLDRDTHAKITNAVVIRVARARPGFGARELHAEIERALREGGAGRFKPSPAPRVPGAIASFYEAATPVAIFAGEMETVQRGKLLYNLHFNATRGSVVEGRKNFAKLLEALKLDVP